MCIPGRPHCICHDPQGKKTMTREEFKEWLKSIDSNGDGCISKDELRAELKRLGMSFTSWKAWRAMVHADLDRNNSIEGEQEIEELIKYAQNHWGITVI